MSSKIHPVILCGGSGTRLWPRSRAARPKPFLPLLGKRTLFEQTLDRTTNPAIFGPATIVAGSAHRDLIAGQSGAAEGVRRIEEPAARNTAPAIALAALLADEDDILLVCPSDHHIADPQAFAVAAESAAALAEENWLVAFGIEAAAPEAGYGYIKRGDPIAGGYAVDRFVEKPDLETARGFVESGEYSWNGGIFCLKAATFLEELAAQRPAMADALRQSVERGEERDGIFHPDEASFLAIDGESIDYAVMENTDRAAVVPVAMGWSDIGNWQALHAASERDADGNSVKGRAQLVDCSNVHVQTDGARVSAIGLEDVVIVVDGDEVLVTTASGAQKVGKLKGAAGQ
uniref:mannose-1-phosphate guanylyltransferase n=1 Tax=Parerythrobacter lutipelagi TaxID=1964208 RepID=UPI0010F4878F|nr:sugar phosphate nucleotidyltransferase [Parerythrobacter lutipelagi]